MKFEIGTELLNKDLCEIFKYVFAFKGVILIMKGLQGVSEWTVVIVLESVLYTT